MIKIIHREYRELFKTNNVINTCFNRRPINISVQAQIVFKWKIDIKYFYPHFRVNS